MKVEGLYKLAKEMTVHVGGTTNVDVTIYLNESKHENLQQEVYRWLNNGNLQGYKSNNIFEILLLNIKFTIKMKV